MKPAPIIIVGMHRSGTSLTTNWLEQSGLNIGEKLLGPMAGNINGHFEDLDFLEFHKKILNDNGLTWRVFPRQQITITSKHLEAAEKIISTKKNNYWGWKDPRTCLFLHFWQQFFPNAKYIFVFRHYSSVADSLLRRRKKAIFNKKLPLWKRVYRLLHYHLSKRKYLNENLDIWERYNSDIVSFLASQKGNINSIIINQDNFLKNEQKIVALIKSQFNLNLSFKPLNTIYDASLMQTNRTIFTIPRNKHKTLKSIYINLQKFESTSLN